MSQTPNRILALDPIHKGFGYAVFEPPLNLIASGLARVEGDKQAGAIVHFEKLLTDYRPNTVVLEDTKAPGSRRRHRVQRLIDALLRFASDRSITVATVSRKAVIDCFSSPEERATKYKIAIWLAQAFPELAPKLPHPRKLWESEDERMSIFDALALAVTYTSKQ
jgi:RNase H-fold protein (predicted Holliday junction resolvase)